MPHLLLSSLSSTHKSSYEGLADASFCSPVLLVQLVLIEKVACHPVAHDLIISGQKLNCPSLVPTFLNGSKKADYLKLMLKQKRMSKEKNLKLAHLTLLLRSS